MIPIVIAPHPDQPLPAGGEGRQSVALAGWGSWRLVSNQLDMISYHVRLITHTVETFRRNVLTTVAMLLLVLINRT
ncbi:MAG: hypothetical protein KME54_01895 [Tolypothrix brevis GSE-NOS-MK-07-07A]|jgi:hypothetical protein|nr:hypothetical protein [Tolypothrix brevis GSE-NOS-MK-07-07A]